MKSLEELSPFPECLFPDARRAMASLVRDEIHRLDGYLARVESHQGHNGSAGLVRAAAICRDAGLSEAETMCKLLWWNQLPVVAPPWSNLELARAVTRVFRITRATAMR